MSAFCGHAAIKNNDVMAATRAKRMPIIRYLRVAARTTWMRVAV
jgi:hypothetical protein